MATIKLKLRKSKVDSSKGMVYYQVCHLRQTIHINTSMQMTPQFFFKISNAVNLYDLEPTLRHYKSTIDYDMSVFNEIIQTFEYGHCEYTVADIRDEFISKKKSLSFCVYAKEQIANLIKKEKFGTAMNYSSTLRSFNCFLNNSLIDIPQIDYPLIMEYNDWLEMKHVSKNTISFYMRNLRAIYNRAVKEALVVQKSPFVDVYTGVEKTRKLAIDEKDLYRLIRMDLSKYPAIMLARDLFVFSFCTRGMAFVDIAFLKKKDICRNVISYKRKKTGQVLIIRVEPCIKRILEKYEDKTKESEYVFPIMKTGDELENYHKYHIALIDYNRNLKRLAKLAKLETNLSSYSARHTWATIAHNHNIPLPVISEGMGHTSETTTRIYLASLENSEIDQANSRILKHINNLISF